MDNIRNDILKTLAYFDCFNYPLTIADIHSFMPNLYNPCDIDDALIGLMEDEIIFKSDQFYSLQNKPGLAEKRRKGNLEAIKQLAIAKKIARVICRFPFVETVAVSGSLSKNYADEKTDIDFFIITAANRLWIARTFMHLFKKLTYVAGKQHWFCMNYYIDESGLEIPEKNIFTAMEIVTLLPMEGFSYFKKFIEANEWINNFFPAHNTSLVVQTKIKKNYLVKFVEQIFNSTIGESLDKRLMRITDRRWKKKTQRLWLNAKGKKMGMMVSRHFSKPDPKNFQAKVIQQYEQKVKQLIELAKPVNAH